MNTIKPIKKWKFKSSSIDICKLLQLAVNFLQYLENQKLPKHGKIQNPDLKKEKLKSRKRDDWTDDDAIVYPGSKMIEIFMEATDFENIFEKDIPLPESEKDKEVKYWEKVFACATATATISTRTTSFGRTRTNSSTTTTTSLSSSTRTSLKTISPAASSRAKYSCQRS